MINFFNNISDRYIRRSTPQQRSNSFGHQIVPLTTKCVMKSFHQKRQFLYRIFIELQKLTGHKGILQINNQAYNKKYTFFKNVDEFFEQTLSSTFQKHVVDAVVQLSNKIKNQPSITDDDKQEFIKGLKSQETQRQDSLCKQKKKKAQAKLLDILEQQVKDGNQNISKDIENQIQESIKNIIEYLEEIFTKEQ